MPRTAGDLQLRHHQHQTIEEITLSHSYSTFSQHPPELTFSSLHQLLFAACSHLCHLINALHLGILLPKHTLLAFNSLSQIKAISPFWILTLFPEPLPAQCLPPVLYAQVLTSKLMIKIMPRRDTRTEALMAMLKMPFQWTLQKVEIRTSAPSGEVIGSALKPRYFQS